MIQKRMIVGVDLETIEHPLWAAVEAGRFDPVRLAEMAKRFGTREVQVVVA